jgi:ABC-type hemin transport system substrate-binding protein
VTSLAAVPSSPEAALKRDKSTGETIDHAQRRVVFNICESKANFVTGKGGGDGVISMSGGEAASAGVNTPRMNCDSCLRFV